MNKFSYVAVYILVTFSVPACADILNDPELYFFSRLPKEPDCLWRLQADLNSDHYPEILLTRGSDRNGKAGHIWTVYSGTKNGFIASNEPISFRADAIYIGYVNGVSEKGLLTYSPASSTYGSLVFFQVKNNSIVETNLGILHPHGEGAKEYKKYFGSPTQHLEKKPIYGGKC